MAAPTPPPAADDDLRRLVEDAARAARAAEAAAERMAREQPSRFEQTVDAIGRLLSALADGLFGRLRAEIEGARRAGQEMVARVLLALSRSLGHLGRALALGLAAAAMLVIGLVVLTIGLVVLLNARLGDPLGTLAAAALLLLAALGLGLAARGRARAIAREAETLAPWRGRS